MHVKTRGNTPAHMKDEIGSERLFNSREARELLGHISERTFRELTKTGALPAVKQGAFVYVRKSAIEAYIAALPAVADRIAS